MQRPRPASSGSTPASGCWSRASRPAAGRRSGTGTTSARTARKITMSLTVSPMTSPSGRVVGYLGVAEDVTERRRVEDMLRVALAKEREAVERLNEVDRGQDRLRLDRQPRAAHADHQRAGLHPDAAARLRRRPHASGRPGCSARVESNGLRLQALIEDLLTLSRIEAGTFPLRVDAGRPARGGAAHAARRPRRMRARPRPRAGSWSRATYPCVVLRRRGPARPGGDQPAHQRREVHPGRRPGPASRWRRTAGRAAARPSRTPASASPTAEQARLFERFFRSATAQQRAIPGTGLGLSIVRSIVHGHGGTVAVELAGRARAAASRSGCRWLVGAVAQRRGRRSRSSIRRVSSAGLNGLTR